MLTHFGGGATTVKQKQMLIYVNVNSFVSQRSANPHQSEYRRVELQHRDGGDTLSSPGSTSVHRSVSGLLSAE